VKHGGGYDLLVQEGIMHRNGVVAVTTRAFLLFGMICGLSAGSAAAQTDARPSAKQSGAQGRTCGRFEKTGEHKWFRSAVHATFRKARIVNRRYCEGLKP